MSYPDPDLPGVTVVVWGDLATPAERVAHEQHQRNLAQSPTALPHSHTLPTSNSASSPQRSKTADQSTTHAANSWEIALVTDPFTPGLR